MLREHFTNGDPRFLDELLACRSDKLVAALAERWYADSRPFARDMLRAYVLDGCDRPKHKPLVKRLFKLAEARGDDELLGCFMVAFDRLLRRELVTVTRYDWRTRSSWQEAALRHDRRLRSRMIPGEKVKATFRDRKTGKETVLEYRADRAEVFSLRTRQYLARRAFRYFRTLGHADPARYRRAMSAALALYRDEHLQKPAQLLDAWGLLHALYWGSPALVRSPQGLTLADGHGLSELEPAPIHEEAWWDGFDELLGVVEKASSRTVRGWALKMLEKHHAGAIERLGVDKLRLLLRSSNEEAQLLGVRALRSAQALDTWPLDEWMALLRIESVVVAPLVCELVEKHVSPDRLGLAQRIELACARLAPVAGLGLRWMMDWPIKTAEELGALAMLASAPVPSVREQAAEWICAQLASSSFTRPEHVRDLIDSNYREVRSGALALMASDERFRANTLLWAALSESPYDDVRAALVKGLTKQEKDFTPETLQHVWATALLAVHRGGKAKRAVAVQIADRIVRAPAEAEALLPLLGVALRSVRAPERRSALAALSRAAFRKPELRVSIEKALPELKLFEEAA